MNKPDLSRIEMEDVKKGEDFIVISKLAMTEEFDMLPYKEGMDMTNIMFVKETPFEEDLVKYVYDIENHKIDIDLAVTVGLGVIRDVASGEEYLYNTGSKGITEDFEADELLRMGIYYQITHPEYIDKKLDILLNATDGGEAYIRMLFTVHDNGPIEKLREIFNAQKGKENNVVKFKKK